MMNKKGKLKSEKLTLDCVSPCRLCRKPFELQERPVYLWSSWFLTTRLTKTPFLTSECRYFAQENCQKSSPTWSNSHFHFTSFSETSTRCRWPWVTHWDSGLNWCLVWIDIERFQCKMRKEAYHLGPGCRNTNIQEIVSSVSYSYCQIRKSHSANSNHTCFLYAWMRGRTRRPGSKPSCSSGRSQISFLSPLL